LSEQFHTARMPLLTAATAFRLGRRCYSSSKRSYLHISVPLINTHTHTTVLRPFFKNYPGELVPEENLLDFMMQGKITEADKPTIRLGVTSSRLISDPSPSSPIFTPDALPATTLPIYPGFGQAPNMLACISSGSVSVPFIKCYTN